MGRTPSRQLNNILKQTPATTVRGVAGPDTSHGQMAASHTASPEPPSAEEPTQAVVTPAGPEVPLQVTVPRRIRQQLMVMAAEQDCSVRALVLKAVRSLGVEVAEDELRDKRRKL